MDQTASVNTNEFQLQSKIKTALFTNEALLSYSLIFLVVYMADAIMSYTTPVFIEMNVNDPSIMGIILSTSSMVGFVMDLIFGEWFRGKSYIFFMFWYFGFAICFPATFIFLPPILVFFLLAMALWGVNYELVQFTNFHFIKSHVSHEKHTFAWGLFSIFKCLGYAIGPVVASYLIATQVNNGFWTAMGFYLFGLFGALIFWRTHKERAKKHGLIEAVKTEKKNLLHETKIWLLLGKRIWPLLAVALGFTLIDAAFWTIGTLLSEQLKQGGVSGEFLLTFYMLPSLFIGLAAPFFANKLGKKRGAYIMAILSGAALIPLGFVTNGYLIFMITFCSAMFGAIAWPLISGVYTDYTERLGEWSNDLIGFQSSIINVGYILGPLVGGLIASTFGIQMTFSVLGVLMIIIATISLLVTPRKIKMPQKSLRLLKQ